MGFARRERDRDNRPRRLPAVLHVGSQSPDRRRAHAEQASGPRRQSRLFASDGSPSRSAPRQRDPRRDLHSRLTSSWWRRARTADRHSLDDAGSNPVCVKPRVFGGVRARWVRPSDMTGLSVLTLWFGSGNGFSEVPAFRDLPAALDSESPLIAFPDPLRFSGRRRRGVVGRWRR